MRKYFKSYISFSLGVWFRAGLSFISVPVISYLIVPEEFGKSAMFAMVFGIISSFMFLGTNQSFLRFFNEYKENERKRLFWACLSPSLLIVTLVTIVMLVLGDHLSIMLYKKVYPKVNLYMSITLYLAAFQHFNQLVIRMRKKGFLYSLVESVNVAGSFVFSLIYALMIERSFLAIVFGNMMGYALALATGIYVGWEYWKPVRFNLSEVKSVLSYGIPFVPNDLIRWVFTSVDRISLRLYSTLGEIGLYSAAAKIVSVMHLVETGFTALWYPVAFERYEKNTEDRLFYIKAFEMVSFLLFAFGFLIVGFKDIIFLLLPRTYMASAQIAPFLILVPIMSTLTLVSTVGINLSKKTHWHMVVSAIAAFMNYIGNSILVPLYSARGAAISTGMCFVIYFYIKTYIAEKLFPVGYGQKKVGLETILLMGVATVGTLSTNVILNILGGLIGFTVTLVLYKEQFKRVVKEIFSSVGLVSRKEK
ncbi:MAG: lipopolysaccharide biosynthesis protein [Pseudothermotoga sp.]